MRLLDSSSLELREFIGDDTPKYVILSHTWGAEEVTFQDIQDFKKARGKKGFRKLKGCCNKAKSDGFRWVWIDTCCIDKSSSAELSEAINSMYEWYKNSEICYAYLEDVKLGVARPQMKETYLTTSNIGSFESSRWWSRGWTLQELIAPSIVEFYASDWTEIGTKLSLLNSISQITGIQEAILENSLQINDINIASRMSWASKRQTSRVEDTAYCLMGIFGVNMPLLYGEGRRAFHRLQEEIIRIHEDYTLLAWRYPPVRHERGYFPKAYLADGIFASSPADFEPLKPWPYSELHPSMATAKLPATPSSSTQEKAPIRGSWEFDPPMLTSRGLSITLPMRRVSEDEYHACLTCTRSTTGVHFCCLKVEPQHGIELAGRRAVFRRRAPYCGPLIFISQSQLGDHGFANETIYLASRSCADDIETDIRGFSSWEVYSHSLVFHTDDNLSIQDNTLFGWFLGHRRRLNSSSGLEVLFGGAPIQPGLHSYAIFRISRLDGGLPFIVAMGIDAKRKDAAWCDVLLHPHIFGKIDNTSDEKTTRHDEIPHPFCDENAFPTTWTDGRNSKLIKEMFELRLDELSTEYLGKQTEDPPQKRCMDHFNDRSDRVVIVLPGAVIRVAVRRSFAENYNRSNRYTLNISLQRDVAVNTALAGPRKSPAESGSSQGGYKAS
ncbi:HET-domain-containing protein [Hyaloscypha variabilis F]|uniref:HET-domain-containing protein n=1 Tax=Hyaloscypha variabilis (strain UAMH 11265 / GT02V1 / F) TaxID=1149755 RepID=A0A2J6R300_HYAVF|nr:HET-domain-containing protein [Hyaloscypha variabilis F]